MASVEESVNEFAMLLVMADEASVVESLKEITDCLERVKSEVASLSDGARAEQACDYVLRQLRSLKPSVCLQTLKDFAAQLQVFMKNPQAASFPGEASKGLQSDETSGSVDPEFLTDFIEKHNSMMEDFEAAINELRYELQASALDEETLKTKRAEFCAFTKGYIHTLKGDAGSIGLTGIEKTCHFVEDIMVAAKADTILDPLVLLKEWVVQCMEAFSKREDVPEASADFRRHFKEACDELLPAPEPKRSPPCAIAAGGPAQILTVPEDLPPEANLDLLAELMAEGFGSAPAPEPAPKAASAAPAAPSKHAEQRAAGEESYSISGEMEVFGDFCAEAEDHLGLIESTLLESDGEISKDSIDAIFRGIHSIKGASSYFTLKEVTETSHVTENLLDEVRDEKRSFDHGLTELVLAYVDLQQNLLRAAREAAKNGTSILRSAASHVYMQKLEAYAKGEAAPAPAMVEVAAQQAQAAPQTAAATPPILAPAEAAEAEKGGAKQKSEKLEVKNFVKVDTQRLDLLIDAIGEMCIYSSMLIQNCRELLGNNERIIKTTHQVEKFSRDLQNIGMSMRLIPIRGLFQKMSRLVWDLGKKVGKDVKFQMHGEETELDRTLIDKLADPLMHMIRNALDHGVEPPDERAAKGKPRIGEITLSAQHSSGNILIQITDDGRGLDPEKLLKKAIEKGIVSENHNLSRDEIYNLIFAPGFSTAAVVTDISGRGVGMDVVKRNIESMRGRVRIESEVGKGSTFTIELPLTLAIIDGIQVAVGKESFIVPTLSIIEFMRPEPKHVMRPLERGETYQFRGRYLPVYRLSELFNVPDCIEEPEKAIFVIVESGGEQAVLMVDQIIGTCSTVIKNLGDMFEQGRGAAGCAIMANGDVALILDVRSALSMAKEIYIFRDRSQKGAGTAAV